jgi:hypothetical protein
MIYVLKMKWWHRVINILTIPIRIAMFALWPVALVVEYIVEGHEIPEDWFEFTAGFLWIEE